jgi:hypothetical protein
MRSYQQSTAGVLEHLKATNKRERSIRKGSGGCAISRSYSQHRLDRGEGNR